VTRLPAIEEK
jgi:hypothetical protein